jgi:hypothetical protein
MRVPATAAAVTREFLKYSYEHLCGVQDLSGKFEPVSSSTNVAGSDVFKHLTDLKGVTGKPSSLL